MKPSLDKSTKRSTTAGSADARVGRKTDMSDNLRSLIKGHHAFYEVLPYYVLLEKSHRCVPATIQRVQAGFDIDIYGMSIKKELTFPGPDPEYALGYSELQKLARELSHDTSCSVEVVPFPSTAVLDLRNNGQVEGMLRIRISHWRGLDQPADLPEQHALTTVETWLHGQGIARR
jgi:hypothetical protein